MEREPLLSCPKGLPALSESDISSHERGGARRLGAVPKEHPITSADADPLCFHVI